MLRVGYQGAPGAFSESAIAVFWEGAVGAVPMSGFADVVRDVADGGVGAAVLPVENTRMGIITDCTLVLQAHPSLRVLWETDISVAAPEAYLAPERPEDAAADLYAVAVLTHEMMTGELPAAGATADAILQSLMAAHPDVSADSLRASALVLARALSREPARRFRTAAEFRGALLERFLRRRDDRLAVEALVRLERGDTQSALEIMRQLVASLPGLRLAYVMDEPGSPSTGQG